MQAVEPAILIGLGAMVVMIAAITGFLVATVVLRRKRRARGFFVLGYSCGLLTGAVLRGRRRGRSPHVRSGF